MSTMTMALPGPCDCSRRMEWSPRRRSMRSSDCCSTRHLFHLREAAQKLSISGNGGPLGVRIVRSHRCAEQLLDGDDGHDEATAKLNRLQLIVLHASVRLCTGDADEAGRLLHREGQAPGWLMARR